MTSHPWRIHTNYQAQALPSPPFDNICSRWLSGRAEGRLPELLHTVCCVPQLYAWSVFTGELGFIMRPSSLGGAAYCVALCLSVCPSVCSSVPLSLPSVTWRHLANYNDTHVLFCTHRRPHIVRPSRPHKLV